LKPGKLRGDEVDRLLRRTLRDDLAPPEEERLRRSMRAAWAEVRARAGGAVPRAPRPGRASRTAPALGLAASLLVALGLLWHMAQPPRIVASSLSAKNTCLLATSRLRNAAAMSGLVESRDAAGRSQRYRIEWRGPDSVHVTLEEAGATASWSLTVAPHSSGFGAAGVPSGASHPESEPRLETVRSLLSPDRIAHLLAGRWDAVERDARERTATYDVTGGRSAVRVTIDERTDLPLRLESGWTATLLFTPGVESPLPFASAAPAARVGGSR